MKVFDFPESSEDLEGVKSNDHPQSKQKCCPF